MVEEKDKSKKDWVLERITISRKTWWDDAGKYSWEITFSSKEWNKFTVALDNERTKQYLAIIADDITRSAIDLWNTIRATLPIERTDTSNKEIKKWNAETWR